MQDQRSVLFGSEQKRQPPPKKKSSRQMLAVNLRICLKSPLCCNRRLRIRVRGSNSRMECHSQHREVLMEAVHLFQSYLTVGRSSYKFLFSRGHAQPSGLEERITGSLVSKPWLSRNPLGVSLLWLGKASSTGCPKDYFSMLSASLCSPAPSKRLSWGDGTPFSDVVLIDRLGLDQRVISASQEDIEALPWAVG